MAGTSDNIFEGGTDFDWSKYISYRPDYRLNNFYDMIWDYHTKVGNGRKDLAYDVGCGPGNVAAAIATEGGFAHIKASDVSDYHVAVARKQLSRLADCVEVEAGKAEDVGRGDEEKVDLVTAGECLALMDVPKAISNFAKLLAPGGTLAVWYYGGPKYIGSDVADIQALHRKITARSFDEFRPFGPFWSSAWVTIASWLDSVELPPQDWRDVRRIKWNEDLPLSYIDEDEFGFEVDYKNHVPEEELVESRKDTTFWAKAADFEFAKGTIDAQIPRTKDYITEEVQGMFDQLEKMMEGRKLQVTWPVVLVLATKR